MIFSDTHTETILSLKRLSWYLFQILDFENITAQVKDLEIQILSEKRHSTEVKERMADLEQEKNSVRCFHYYIFTSYSFPKFLPD